MTLEIAGRPVGFCFIRDAPTRDMVRLAVRAEELGFESVWAVEHNFGRDAITPMAAMAYATSRVRLGVAVVPIFTRTPLLLAATWATLDELAEGRLIIGLGAGSRLMVEAQGISYAKPVTALRENVELIRTLLRDRHATLHGKVVVHEAVELDFEPYRPEIPFWLGVTGPRALETSGEIAEGAILNAFTSLDYTRRAVDLIAAGRARRDDPPEFETATMVVCMVDEDRAAAVDRMRPILAVYLARLPDVAKVSGFDEERVERIREHLRDGDDAAGAALVTDEMVDTLTACGPPSWVRERVEEYVDAGVTYPLICPIDRWQDMMTAVATSAPARQRSTAP